MSQEYKGHAWWSRLRHQGLLLSPVVLLDRYPSTPERASYPTTVKLRDAHTRFVSTSEARKGDAEIEQSAVLAWVDHLLEQYLGHRWGRLAKQNAIPEKLSAVVRIGTRSETIKPHRVVYADANATVPALLVMADTSATVGRGRGRTKYAQLIELLRRTGHRLGLLTNGRQFRLIYAGLDFESWCEWEAERWFDDDEGSEELAGLRQLLSTESLALAKEGVSGLLDAIEESRKRQADLSVVLRENVRRAVEFLLEDVSAANRMDSALFHSLMNPEGGPVLTDSQGYEALYQATVRVVMRLVVCLFAESRGLLPTNDPIYGHAYGVRSLYERLEEAVRNEGGLHTLFNKNSAWPRIMALFRLIHGGSTHGAFPMRAYGGALFRPGDARGRDAVTRALHILEHAVPVGDSTIHNVLSRLVRGRFKATVKSRGQATIIEGPVDYTDLRTEFIGLIYEGLLDYRIKRTNAEVGPQVFLNIGREPVLPLRRLQDMLVNDRNGLKNLLTTLRKEKVTATTSTSTEEQAEEEMDEDVDDQPESVEEAEVESESKASTDDRPHGGDYLDAVESAKRWAREAAVMVGLVSKQGKRETDAEYQQRSEDEAARLIKRVVATGEFYLVRAGNTRKGTGTFYTRPQLAVPTVHRTLEPLCYDKVEDGTLIAKEPEAILGLKVCDPACGSASFLVAALHYLTDALYRSLCHHRQLYHPERVKRITLPYGRLSTGKEGDELVPFSPGDKIHGHFFEERVKALLRRHVVERCIYGVDINPLAVELARVSLWVETLDPNLPFSFLDHKIKVGNALVGCWLELVEDYPIKAWEREGGDGKNGERTGRIETFLKGEKVGRRRSGDGLIKQEMRQIIESRFTGQPTLFPEIDVTAEAVVAQARAEYEALHSLPPNTDPDEREKIYREQVLGSPAMRRLRRAMDEWCAVWFWPTDEESLRHVPTPQTFHAESLETRSSVIDHLSSALKFFHWELEYLDVFMQGRSGFDAIIGNPPWETVQQESKEFFSEFDPVYPSYGKTAAVQCQRELFAAHKAIEELWENYCGHFSALNHWIKCAADPFDTALTRGKQDAVLRGAWAKARSNRISASICSYPFQLQGSGKNFTYKLFLEIAHALLRQHGRLGFIVPSGIYSDNGAKELRELFIDRSGWEILFSFENKRKIFDIHRSFKFAPIVISKELGIAGTKQSALFVAFMVHELNAWEQTCPPMFEFDKSLIKLFSPNSKSLPEVRTKRDLSICYKIYSRSIRIGDKARSWDISYAQEFNMTSDSACFDPREKWEAQGYRPDVYGRWVGPNGDVALPLVQGGMIWQLDGMYQGYGLNGEKGWNAMGNDAKQFNPKFLMAEETYRKEGQSTGRPRLVFRDIARSTDQRTLVAALVPDFPCGNKTPVLRNNSQEPLRILSLAAVLSSMILDFAARTRVAGATLNWFIVEELPVCQLDGQSLSDKRLTLLSARLGYLHRCFAPEWLKLKQNYPELSSREWKNWWAVTEADRLRLRVEIDAICADLYGLNPDDFDWIVRDDPTDPKGFWRVDRDLPFRERLTGLAATAFRALKEERWSAESAASLSNDEFFALLGISELTSVPAAHALGLPAPLITKRQGCHSWQPQSFAPEDPRNGWTWDDCWNDAVALLGSEKAVKTYVEGNGATRPTTASAILPTKSRSVADQGKLFD